MDNIYVNQLNNNLNLSIIKKLIKLNYYKLLITSIKINNKYKYPLLKLHPKHSNSSYHKIRHQIELINYPTK